MKNSIMTEKIARRGVKVPSEYSADFFERVAVKQVATSEVRSLRAHQLLSEFRDSLANSGLVPHQAWPVLDEKGHVVGVLSRKDLLDPLTDPSTPLGQLVRRPPAVVYPDSCLREAADLMVSEEIGRLVVVERGAPLKPVGILTRSDLLKAHSSRLRAEHHRS
jgi:CBS domain-containing protein